MRKTIALMTLSVELAILTPMPSVAGVPLRPLKSRILIVASQTLGVG